MWLVWQNVSYKTKDKHIDSALCKRTRNENTHSNIIGECRTMGEKHTANGDVDYDGVIKSEPHEKIKCNTYKRNYIYTANMFHCWDILNKLWNNDIFHWLHCWDIFLKNYEI